MSSGGDILHGSFHNALQLSIIAQWFEWCGKDEFIYSPAGGEKLICLKGNPIQELRCEV
ncbi:hypothetical protein CS8_096620 [Cupriavidus sp. 8B]